MIHVFNLRDFKRAVTAVHSAMVDASSTPILDTIRVTGINESLVVWGTDRYVMPLRRVAGSRGDGPCDLDVIVRRAHLTRALAMFRPKGTDKVWLEQRDDHGVNLSVPTGSDPNTISVTLPGVEGIYPKISRLIDMEEREDSFFTTPSWGRVAASGVFEGVTALSPSTGKAGSLHRFTAEDSTTYLAGSTYGTGGRTQVKPQAWVGEFKTRLSEIERA